MSGNQSAGRKKIAEEMEIREKKTDMKNQEK